MAKQSTGFLFSGLRETFRSLRAKRQKKIFHVDIKVDLDNGVSPSLSFFSSILCSRKFKIRSNKQTNKYVEMGKQKSSKLRSGQVCGVGKRVAIVL